MKTQLLTQANHRRTSIVAVGILRLASNVADTETLTIGADVYEINSTGGVTAGRYTVDCSGGVTPAVASVAIVAAINARAGITGIAAYKVSDNIVAIFDNGLNKGAVLATTETLAGANNGFAAATLTKVGQPTAARGVAMQQRVVSALEETLDNMVFVFPFTVTAVLVQVRTTAGVIKAYDGAITQAAVSGGTAVFLAGAGAVDADATDVVTVLAC